MAVLLRAEKAALEIEIDAKKLEIQQLQAALLNEETGPDRKLLQEQQLTSLQQQMVLLQQQMASLEQQRVLLMQRESAGAPPEEGDYLRLVQDPTRPKLLFDCCLLLLECALPLVQTHATSTLSAWGTVTNVHHVIGICPITLSHLQSSAAPRARLV